MHTPDNDPFYSTISILRVSEEILIHNKFMNVPPASEKAVTDLLAGEYEKESLGFPANPPAYDGAAALWGARIMYIGSQLLLFRDKGEADLNQLLPFYKGILSAGAVLSADLCLRFVPDLINKLRQIDPEDPLIGMLEERMRSWPYSAIGRLAAIDASEIFFTDSCLRQLFVDRIIARKDRALAESSLWKPLVMAALGEHVKQFWKELSITI